MDYFARVRGASKSSSSSRELPIPAIDVLNPRMPRPSERAASSPSVSASSARPVKTKAVQPAVEAGVGKGVVVVRSSRVNGGLVERNGEHDDDALGT